jgi:hypothetical protein
MPANPILLLSQVVDMVNDGELEAAESAFAQVYESLRGALHADRDEDGALIEALDLMREALARGHGAAFHEAHDLFDDALASHRPLLAA